MNTITVNTYFGDRQMSREEFVKEWEDHMRQLHRLSWRHMHEFQQMQARVAELAGEEFDRKYKAEQEKEALGAESG